MVDCKLEHANINAAHWRPTGTAGPACSLHTRRLNLGLDHDARFFALYRCNYISARVCIALACATSEDGLTTFRRVLRAIGRSRCPDTPEDSRDPRVCKYMAHGIE